MNPRINETFLIANCDFPAAVRSSSLPKTTAQLAFNAVGTHALATMYLGGMECAFTECGIRTVGLL